MNDYVDIIDIEGVQYDIQDTPTKTQAEENAQKIEELENLDLYSLEEIQTASKWIDNKPIYRKVIATGALPNATQKSVPHGIANMDKVVKILGVAENPTSRAFAVLPLVSGTAGASVLVTAYTDRIVMQTGSNWSVFSSSYIILEYTKTTDTSQP